ncbi:hypothetical protein [Lysinibacter sp. HNR]|uniref:hypothetical protein n=1 Tax=Lysinibacter sp. HNR TaxID=3031408 RepID=UPI002435C86F|nr:hypothetical protein [Lysinibacter sp. HNR]WGD37553.1 hypothetical protein FrondiHNR_01115 [Lysinibacter sp. HNR]
MTNIRFSADNPISMVIRYTRLAENLILPVVGPRTQDQDIILRNLAHWQRKLEISLNTVKAETSTDTKRLEQERDT